MTTILKSNDIAEKLNLPSKGDIVSGVTILDSESKLKDGTFGYKLTLPTGVRRGDLNNVLRDFFSTNMITFDGKEYVVENHDYQTKPTRNGTILTGYLDLVSLSKTNPGKKLKLTALQDFNKEYSEMVMTKPGSYFKIESYTGFNGPKFRSKLFSFVSKRGENYGYTDGKNLYYRRASLVAPQIKITKSPENANMFYHTHPAKDEPTMSSADDYLLYIDMSHKPRNIRHFYTVMADRMDYFHVTPRHNKKKDYVRINEDKFIDELDNQIENIGKRLDEKYPNNTHEDDLHYCEMVTREVVTWLNKKYSKYVKIKYKCYYRVRKNPDKPTGSDLHLGNEYIAKGLNDIKTGKYSWPEFGSKDKPEESYAYWHSRYFSMNKDMKGTGYIGLLPGDMRRLEVFLHDSYRGTNYSYNDILGILCLSYDINTRDKKITDGKDGVSRITDILDYLEIEDNVLREDIMMLDSLSSIPYGELAKSVDDHYFILPMAHFSMESVAAMNEVKAGKRDKERAKYDIMVTLREKMAKAVAKSLGDENNKVRHDIYSKEPDPETGEKEIIDPARTVTVYGLDGAVQKDRVNPPIGIKKREYAAYLPTRIFENPDLIAEILEEDFKKGDKPITVRQTNAYNILVKVENSAVSMMIQPSTGSVQLNVPAAGFPSPEDPEQTVLDAFRILIEKLNTRGFDIPTDDIRIGNIEPMRNPNNGNLVAIMGPIQTTKDKVIDSLSKRLDGVIVTKYTTRPLKEYQKRSSLVEVTDEVFDKMASNGDILVITSDLDGFKIGLSQKDFASDGLILVDIGSEDLPFLMGSVPHVKTFFLQPTNEAAGIKKFLMQEVSPQEAERVSSSIEEPIDVDNVIEYDIDQPAGAIEEIYSEIPKKNPFTDPSGSVYVPSGGQHYLRVRKNPNLGVVPTSQSQTGTPHFINQDTGELLSGYRAYDGAVLEIVDGKWKAQVGDPISFLGEDGKFRRELISRQNQKLEFNVAAAESEDKSRRHIIEWTGNLIFTDKVTIDTPVFLKTDPLSIQEPKATIVTKGRLQMKGDKVPLEGKPTDFEGRSKSNQGDAYPAYVSEMKVISIDLWREQTHAKRKKRQTRENPQKVSVRIEESTNPEKKLMAVFAKPNGRTKTVHFGARGMSDYTQHKDKDRMKSYLARHGGMGEDWNDPMTAGALSRWILWGKPSLRDSFNDFKKRFNMEGVMAVTNTKMNPPWRTEGHENPYIIIKEPWSNYKVPIDERLAPLIQHLWNNDVPTSYSDQGLLETNRGYLVIRWPYDYAKPIVDRLVKDKIVKLDKNVPWRGGDRVFPENSVTIRWDGEESLKKIYKEFKLPYPESRAIAIKQIKDMGGTVHRVATPVPSLLSTLKNPNFLQSPEKRTKRFHYSTMKDPFKRMKVAEDKILEKGYTIEVVKAAPFDDWFKAMPEGKDKASKQVVKWVDELNNEMYQKSIEMRFVIKSKMGKELARHDNIYLREKLVIPKSLVEKLKKKNRKQTSWIDGAMVDNYGDVRRDFAAMIRLKKPAIFDNYGEVPTKSQRGKGLYGILKEYEAAYCDAHGIESFSAGAVMRADMYRSYGWLNAVDYSEESPYKSKAAEVYFRKVGKDAWDDEQGNLYQLWRPVWPRDKPSKNPGWRHGKQMENDPFEDEFE